ncbi:MAG: hypothetical protein ACRELG_11785 [Gemmataceae bacterium]
MGRYGNTSLPCLAVVVLLAGAAHGESIPGTKPRTDLYGDPLPTDALVRFGSVRDRMKKGITSLAYLPGSDLLVAGSRDEGILAVFSREGKIISRLALEGANSDLGGALAVSPDGKRLAVPYEAGILVGDMKTKKAIRKIRCNFGLWLLLLSPDGKRVAAAGSRLDSDGVRTVGDAALWSTDTGEQVRRFPKGCSALVFSPSGDLITGAGRTIFLWDGQTGAERAHIDTEHPEILALAVSADGKMLVSGGADKTIVLWDLATRKVVRRFASRDGNVHFLAFTPDGKSLVSASSFLVTTPSFKTLVSSGSEESCALWDVATGRCRHRFLAGGLCALSADGKTLATGEGNLIQRWDLTANPVMPQRPSPHFTYSPFMRNYKPIAFAPDGKTVAFAGRPWSVWDAATGRMLRQWPTQPRAPLLGFSREGKPIFGKPCPPHHSWDFATGKRFHVARDPTLYGSPVFTADGKHLTQVFRSEIVSTDVDTGETLHRVPVKGGYDFAEAILSPNGRLVAWAFPGYPFLYDNGGEQLITLCSADSGEILRKFGSRKKAIFAEAVNPLTFSADGRWLAGIVSYNSLALWETSTGKERIRTPREKPMRDLAFSPDGQLLAVCEDGRVRVWETFTGKEVHQFRGQQGIPVIFSPDGTRLLTSSADGTALLWDVAGRTLPAKSTPADLERWWDQLGSEAPLAFQARRRLTAAAGKSVPFLSKRLQTLSQRVSAERLARLLADLDSDQFQTRERATAELKKLGGLVEPALRKAIASRPSLEVRLRIENLLDGLDHRVLSREELQGLRGVETLESIGSAEARRVLATQARGTPGFRLTDKARMAVERLTRHRSLNP